MLDLSDYISYYDGKKKQKKDYQLEVDSEYVYYKSEYIKQPKISSHTLVDLLDFNKFSRPGKTILNIFGLTKKSPIDPYQTYKGGIVEIFAKRFLLKEYGADADIEAFTVSQFKDSNMNQFPEAAPFSGVLDIMMHMPIKLPVEVKSKEMKEYERIVKHGMYPKDQLVQGANQAVLAGVDKYMMLWGFISEDLSKLLKTIAKEDLWLWEENYEQAIIDLELSEDDVKFHYKIFE